MGSRLSLPQ